jgi:hypothetical protein
MPFSAVCATKAEVQDRGRPRLSCHFRHQTFVVFVHHELLKSFNGFLQLCGLTLGALMNGVRACLAMAFAMACKQNTNLSAIDFSLL